MCVLLEQNEASGQLGTAPKITPNLPPPAPPVTTVSNCSGYVTKEEIIAGLEYAAGKEYMPFDPWQAPINSSLSTAMLQPLLHCTSDAASAFQRAPVAFLCFCKALFVTVRAYSAGPTCSQDITLPNMAGKREVILVTVFLLQLGRAASGAAELLREPWGRIPLPLPQPRGICHECHLLAARAG